MKETDEGLGCILFVVAVFLVMFLIYHGSEIANMILGHCA